MSDRFDYRTVDEWLEAQFESRISGDGDPDGDLLDPPMDSDRFEEDDLSEIDLHTSPASFHALDQLDVAPLQLKIDTALAELSDQLSRGHTQHFHQVIRFYAKFHTYSLANAILIMLQKPDADVVAGYRRWQELGHQVRRNTKAAQIWCPVIRKADEALDETEDTDGKVLVGFRTGYVFSNKDLIDAETLELPSLRSPLPDDHAELLAYVKERAMASGVTIREVEHIAGAEGYYHRGRHEVVLQSKVDSHNQILILLHEWAHALFHQRADAATWPKAQKEFEAETVAMVVGQLLGIEAPAASDYLLVYGATPEQLKSSFVHVHGLVQTMSKHLGLAESPVARGPADASRNGRAHRH